MSAVTKLTRDQYVALVEAGGRAFGFGNQAQYGGPPDEAHAARALIEDNFWDPVPDADTKGWVYYTLTE